MLTHWTIASPDALLQQEALSRLAFRHVVQEPRDEELVEEHVYKLVDTVHVGGKAGRTFCARAGQTQ